jgi:hypoxanthine phosphoribosyltransferase
MQDDIDRVLIDRHTIALRIEALAKEITRDLCPDLPAIADEPAPEPQITLVPLLTGSFIFAADLIRHLPVKLKIRLLSVSSYPGTATSSRGAQIKDDLTHLPRSLAGQHVLVVDDILDSGNTLRLVGDTLAAMKPASLRTCVLLRKQRPQAMSFPVDYVAFDIPDEFVVGYGLDFNDHYRNLPDIVTLRPEVIAAAVAAQSAKQGSLA